LMRWMKDMGMMNWWYQNQDWNLKMKYVVDLKIWFVLDMIEMSDLNSSNFESVRIVKQILSKVDLWWIWSPSLNDRHFVSSPLISSHLISSHLISSHLISSPFTSLQFSSIRFNSLHFSSVRASPAEVT
jgi:hypothetical protein